MLLFCRYPVHPTVSSESQNLLFPSNHADCTSCSEHFAENDAPISSNPLYENNPKMTHNSILNGEIINDNHYLLDTVCPSPMNIGSLPHIPPIMQELKQTKPPVDSLPPSPSELCIVVQDHDEFDEMKDCEKFNTTYSLEVQTTGREGLQRLPFEDFTTSPDNLVSSNSSNSSTLFSSCSSISSSNCTVHGLATYISTLESPLPSPTSSPPHSPSLSLPISIPFSKAVPLSFTFLPSPSPSPPITSLPISIPIKVWLKARKRRRKNSRRNGSSSVTSLIKPKLESEKDVIIIDDVANRGVPSQDPNANDTNSSAMGTSTEEKNEVLKKLEEVSVTMFKNHDLKVPSYRYFKTLLSSQKKMLQL